MTVDLPNFDWKLLRILARGGSSPVKGRELRHAPTRQTKDGTFLGRLVEKGLIAVSAANDDPFAATYSLTALGRHAAEYGEYDARMPWEKPLPAPEPAAKAAARKAKK